MLSSPRLWRTTRRSPDGYPDAVTLASDVSEREVLAEIDVSAGCSVTDSFADLDLSAQQFHVLFDANWIHRAVRGTRSLVGGVAFNRSGSVVGLSNLSAVGVDPVVVWRDAVLVAEQWFPGRPLVGYERDLDLEHATAAGFATIGPLRVWMR